MMTQVRFIPIAVEGGKIIENKGNETLNSSLEYEDTFVEYFKRKPTHGQISKTKDHHERAKSVEDLNKIWTKIQSLEKLPTSSNNQQYENYVHPQSVEIMRNKHVQKVWPENFDSIKQVQDKVRHLEDLQRNQDMKSKESRKLKEKFISQTTQTETSFQNSRKCCIL